MVANLDQRSGPPCYCDCFTSGFGLVELMTPSAWDDHDAHTAHLIRERINYWRWRYKMARSPHILYIIEGLLNALALVDPEPFKE